MAGEAIVGGETGRVGRAGGQAGRAQLLRVDMREVRTGCLQAHKTSEIAPNNAKLLPNPSRRPANRSNAHNTPRNPPTAPPCLQLAPNPPAIPISLSSIQIPPPNPPPNHFPPHLKALRYLQRINALPALIAVALQKHGGGCTGSEGASLRTHLWGAASGGAQAFWKRACAARRLLGAVVPPFPTRNDDVTPLLFTAFYCLGGRDVTLRDSREWQQVPPAAGACLAVQQPAGIN